MNRFVANFSKYAAFSLQAAQAASCQHVSRHRFQYTPPATPDGYWDINIGSVVYTEGHAERDHAESVEWL